MPDAARGICGRVLAGTGPLKVHVRVVHGKEAVNAAGEVTGNIARGHLGALKGKLFLSYFGNCCGTAGRLLWDVY